MTQNENQESIPEVSEQNGAAQSPLRPRKSTLGIWIILAGILIAYYFSARTKPSAVEWERDFEAGLQQAQEDEQLVLLYFHATWCGPCKQLQNSVFSRQDVADALSDYVPIKIDVDQQKELVAQYGVEPIPTVILCSPEGRRIFPIEGLFNADAFIEIVTQAQAKWDEFNAQSQNPQTQPA